MPKKKEEYRKCIDSLRHNEYYGMQATLDELYQRSSNNETFDNLMDYVVSENNILLAYRNMKKNGGSKTPGTDNLSILDIEKLSPNEVVYKVREILLNKEHGYRPKPVRRKEIPKPNGNMRPLGIPCIWDRLIQQCLLQVLEPICEAKFSPNSFGFRPGRSVENAIARTYRLMQMTNLHYVACFDIKGFFDNVDHSKLIKQIWAMGIHDKTLIWIIRRILKAPIKMPNNEIIIPQKGTPQGGIISPLLANVVLNELDQWIDSQWQFNPINETYKSRVYKNGTIGHSHAKRGMRETTKLKEMYIVRYADDFRIFCRTKDQADKAMIATTQWLNDRLRLEVSQEKTCIVDTQKRYFEFLGFSIKVHKKSPKTKYVVTSHISEKALKRLEEKLVKQVKVFCSYQGSTQEAKEVVIYNTMVLGMQNYYRIATNVAEDLRHVQLRTYRIMYNRLNTQRGNRLVKKGRELTKLEKERYGKTKSLRFIAGTKEPIYPIGYVQFKNPIALNAKMCMYTPEGRAIVHEDLRINVQLLGQLARQKFPNRSIEYYDNRLSLFSAQWGKCYVTGEEFLSVEDIHCHHIIPRSRGGTDEYSNLVLIKPNVHTLVHASKLETVELLYKVLNINIEELRKLNRLRREAGQLGIILYKDEPHLRLEPITDVNDSTRK